MSTSLAIEWMIRESESMPTEIRNAILNDVDKDENLTDFLNGDRASGYCYLNLLPIELQFSAVKAFHVWPTLSSLISNCKEHLYMFIISSIEKRGRTYFCHVQATESAQIGQSVVKFRSTCSSCDSVYESWSWDNGNNYFHNPKCPRTGTYKCRPIGMSPDDMRIGGFFSNFTKSRSAPSRSSSKRKSITASESHEDKQVLNFNKSVKGDGMEPDMTRELYSVPKPDEIETMTDHIQNHKSGDIFPYFSVVGNEEETKEGRLSRLRAFKSAYGKENKPEMRINGVILDELEGTILVKQLKDHVDETKLNKQQARQNKKFKPIDQVDFKKPYFQLTRITGEYVPLMSSTADYAELYFTLEDGRLLDNQTIVQSNKLPTNQNGVFELACDYCINLEALGQLSLKYYLSRPIMRNGFQWGSISLVIRMSESDTPYMIPKVEAMAIVRAPYTTLEDQTKDPDHADVVYTSAQIKTFQEMYRAGEIMDIDEAKKVRTKANSYSKSTLRGAIKGEAGPDHLGNQSGWEHLKGMRKPRIADGAASISAASGEDDEEDITVNPTTKQEYEAQQEAMRKQFGSIHSDTTEEVLESEMVRSQSPSSDRQIRTIDQVTPPKSALKKARFDEMELSNPDPSNVYKFD